MESANSAQIGPRKWGAHSIGYVTTMPNKVTFTPPQGAVPEGTEMGADFDLVCTFRLEKGGTVCLTMMGDHKMPGYGGEEAEHRTRARNAYSDEAKAMMGAGGGGAAGGGMASGY
jgi:hypothetical protein